MARCSCGNASCSCVVKAAPDSGVIVTGSGSAARPYLIDLTDSGNDLANLEVVDTPSLNLSLAGAGVPGDRMRISGVSTPALTGLRDVLVGDVPASGDVPTWNGSAWEFKPPADGGGSVALSGVWGSPLQLDKFSGMDSLTGLPIYEDTNGQIRAQPSVLYPVSGKAAADLPATYPLGVSLLTLTTSVATAGGWPNNASASVLTMLRMDSPVASSASGFQIWCRNSGPTVGAAEMQFRTGTGSGWSTWSKFAGVGQDGVPVDCTSEVKMCTSGSSTPNTGSAVGYARYTKIGKTVTFWGIGTMGSAVVTGGAILLPASAGTPAFRQYFPPPGVYMTATTWPASALANSVMTVDLLRVVFNVQNSSSYYDFPANASLRWQFSYEVA